ncbi:MAG: S8 family serine peptidase [Bacteroidales bacterium]|nr:S8 family serine peptidase [Bacteroidales bacterium]
MKTKCVSLFVLLLFCGSLHAQTTDPKYMDGAVYFQLKTEFPLAALHVDGNARVNSQDVSMFKDIFDRYEVTDVLRPFHLFGDAKLLRTLEVRFARWEAIDSLVADLQAHEWVAYAEKVPLMRTCGTPNDPYYGTVKNRNWKWHLDLIHADSAWKVQQGSPNIKVAVVDGFVWGNHPDLQIDSANQCSVSYSTTSGYTYSVGSAAPPASVVQNNSATAYHCSHGTHCAGLVGAINNNGEGIASIGSGVTLIGVAATTSQYPTAVLYGLQGVQWAAEHGAKVISLSFGTTVPTTIQRNLMQTCHDAGIVMLAAAGNEGDEENAILYPAGYNTVISVASVDGDGKLSYFSQWGNGRADIAAPGGYITGTTYPNILSTTFCKAYAASSYGFSNTYYDGMQGTSMACPVAAGVVGLLLSLDPTLKPDEIKSRLQRTATPLNPASTHTISGYGYIDAYAALLNEHLTLSKDSLFFPKDTGHKLSLRISSSHTWTLSGLPSWLSASTLSGTSGETEVIFTTLEENTTEDIRTASIRITGGGKTDPKEIFVCQEKTSFYLRVSPKNITLNGKKNARDTFYVSCSNAWELENSSSWLSTSIREVTADSFVVTLQTSSNNSSGKLRNVDLLVKAKGFDYDTVYVTQLMSDFLSLSSTTLDIGPATNDTVSITVYSNISWTLNGSATWVQADHSQGKDTERVVFTVIQDNTTGSVRSSTFRIGNISITKSFSIRQAHNLAVVETNPEILRVMPNPTNGRVECTLIGKEADHAGLYDMQGRLLQTRSVEAQRVTFDLDTYAAGMYLIRCGQATAKIIKK